MRRAILTGNSLIIPASCLRLRHPYRPLYPLVHPAAADSQCPRLAACRHDDQRAGLKSSLLVTHAQAALPLDHVVGSRQVARGRAEATAGVTTERMAAALPAELVLLKAAVP